MPSLLNRLAAVLLFLVLGVASAAAQSTAAIGRGSTSGTGLLTSDADDASIAAAQTNSNVNSLTMAFDGSVWRRITFGVAGTPSAQVTTVQGITSGTPLNVAPRASNGDALYHDAADAVRFLPVDSTGVVQTWASDICSDSTLVTSVPINTATSGNVQLVALSGSTKVTACGYHFTTAGAVEVQFVYGTGSACGTGETILTGPMKFVADGDSLVVPNGAKAFATPAGQALCIELSAAVQVSGLFTYVQQ